jgi:hypothetical protein
MKFRKGDIVRLCFGFRDITKDMDLILRAIVADGTHVVASVHDSSLIAFVSEDELVEPKYMKSPLWRLMNE